jgi:hypothetical protein
LRVDNILSHSFKSIHFISGEPPFALGIQLFSSRGAHQLRQLHNILTRFFATHPQYLHPESCIGTLFGLYTRRAISQTTIPWSFSIRLNYDLAGRFIAQQHPQQTHITTSPIAFFKRTWAAIFTWIFSVLSSANLHFLLHSLSSINIVAMLRRAPTTITLTQADIEQWEVSRQRKLHEAQEKLAAEIAANESSVGAKSKESRQKSTKDRIMGGTGQGR